MLLKDAKLPENIKRILLDTGINELRPPQILAVENDILEKNIIVASPTASGKTLIAEIAFLNAIINENKKCIYLVPLRSLASEKYYEFKEKYDKIMDIGLSIGDLDSEEKYLGKCDLILCTSEKLDSLLRHGVDWMQKIGLVIADEIHLLGDGHRGATLEVLITRLKTGTRTKFLGLSATIKNAKEISEWLNAGLVQSDYRPVELKEGVHLETEIDFFPEKIKLKEEKEPLYSILKETAERKKQAIIFVNSRKRAEQLAEKCPELDNSAELKNVSDKVLNTLEKPTPQCERLSKLILKGVAFHHAGLLNKQRTLIEKEFRKGNIRTIFATPTLSMGVDLPAFRVLIKDLKRYSPEEGYSEWIKVGEYKQLAGRAGRPKYESWGEAVTFAKSEEEKQYILENFILGETENIYSQLSHEPTLRMHILSLISQNVINKEEDIIGFFNNSFHAHQYGNADALDVKIRKVLDDLESYEFIKCDVNKIIPTPLGKRVTQLYLDPESAYKMIIALAKANEKELNAMSFLHTICMTFEMKPLLRLNKDDIYETGEDYELDKAYLLFEEPSPYDYEYETFLKAYKTAQLFNSWIEEVNEDQIMKKFGIGPGDLRAKNVNADWLLYSLSELARMLKQNNLITPINTLRLQLKYGISSELIPLVKYKGIGRVRARKLYNAGITNARKIKQAPLAELSRLIGVKTARTLLIDAGADEKISDSLL